MRLLISCIIILCAMYGSVFASEEYAASNPQGHLQLKMAYCIDAVREEGRQLEDLGCKVGQGYGKAGVKKDITRKLVERIDMNTQSFMYKQLTSYRGLKLTFKDEALGSKGIVQVWQDAQTGRMRIQVCKEN